jgi:uncharacterized membrane protein YfcA
MQIWEAVLLFAAGGLAGFVNVLAGGGSLLTMPIMVFMGLPGPTVNGTNRVAILVQTATAVTGFFRRGFSDFRLSLSLTVCAIPGTVVGALLGTRLEGVWFNRVLAAVMVAILLLMARTGKGRSDEPAGGSRPPTTRRLVVAHVLMVGAGFYGGFLQAGVGFLLMAILHRSLGLDLVRVNMHKVFIVGGYTLVALAIFASRGHVYWSIGFILAGGNALGAWLGTHYAVAKGERLIRLIFNLAVLALACKLVISSLN